MRAHVYFGFFFLNQSTTYFFFRSVRYDCIILFLLLFYNFIFLLFLLTILFLKILRLGVGKR